MASSSYVRPVYIFGAGASVVAGAPLVADFKEAAEACGRGMNERILADRFSNALNIWNGIFPKANIEEYYVALELIDGLHPPEFKGFRGDVEYLIFRTLHDLLIREVCETHVRFAIQSRQRASGRAPSIISLNWDSSLDAAINSSFEPGVDYGFPKARPYDDLGKSGKMEGVFPVLKLHGSMNWGFCNSCGTLWTTKNGDIPLAIWEGRDSFACKSRGCTGFCEPIIVPPTSHKVSSLGSTNMRDRTDREAPLRSVWIRARKEISQCTELAVVGYSFPTTDLQFKMFLIEALSENASLRQIGIVTSPKFGSEKQKFEDHFSKIFESTRHHHRLSFKYQRYEDWVEQGCIL